MAEQFLNKLNDIEKSIEKLGETLARMITIIGTVSEAKSEVRMAKDELLERIAVANARSDASESNQKMILTHIQALKEEIATISKTSVSSGASSLSKEDLRVLIKAEMGDLASFIEESLAQFKEDMIDRVESTVLVQTPPVESAAKTPPPIEGAIPADRGMKIADYLDEIVESLKMGCVAGDVLEVMNNSKAEIMKVVPSDPIMVKIDKWAGVVAGYSKRHELQARDILKLKKEIREEIPKYRPA